LNLICPNCNARLSLEALAEDAEARKLFGLLSQHEQAAGAMVQYLQLFKPPKQALRWARALKLAKQLLTIADRAGCLDDQLAEACLRTVAAMEGKRARGEWQPLTSHRYFEKVLGEPDRPRPAVVFGPVERPPCMRHLPLRGASRSRSHTPAPPRSPPPPAPCSPRPGPASPPPSRRDDHRPRARPSDRPPRSTTTSPAPMKRRADTE